MGNDIARVAAAGEYVTVDGKEYKVSPISIQQLHELQKEALHSYKKEYLRTYQDNLELLSGDTQAILEKKLETVARWDISDLPAKVVYGCDKIPLTEKIREWLLDEFGNIPTDDAALRSVLSTALDQGRIDEQRLVELTGAKPNKIRSPYDTWWVTADYDGIMAMIWTSVHMEHPDVTRDDIRKWPLMTMMETARAIESMTAPAVGNM